MLKGKGNGLDEDEMFLVVQCYEIPKHTKSHLVLLDEKIKDDNEITCRTIEACKKQWELCYALHVV